MSETQFVLAEVWAKLAAQEVEAEHAFRECDAIHTLASEALEKARARLQAIQAAINHVETLKVLERGEWKPLPL